MLKLKRIQNPVKHIRWNVFPEFLKNVPSRMFGMSESRHSWIGCKKNEKQNLETF